MNCSSLLGLRSVPLFTHCRGAKIAIDRALVESIRRGPGGYDVTDIIRYRIEIYRGRGYGVRFIAAPAVRDVSERINQRNGCPTGREDVMIALIATQGSSSADSSSFTTT